MKRELYPSNWEEIRRRIRTERAENKCEWCGVTNHAYGYRDEAGNFVEVSQQEKRMDLVTESGQLLLDCVAVHPQYKKLFRVVLTVAHLGADKPDGSPGDKQDKQDCREENLAALCQRCHLRFDVDEHQENARQTRLLKRIARGQLTLPI
jgi:hypothetical protein